MDETSFSCPYVFKSGKRKGNVCGKVTSGKYCKRHSEPPPAALSNSGTLDTIEILNYKLLTTDMTSQNKSVIMKRLRYVETLPNNSNEYQKNINWIRHALSFPYNAIKEVPITVEASPAEVSDYLKKVYSKLDNYIHGLDQVKEEILSFVCKRISNPNSNDHVLALQGERGTGKTRLALGLADALGIPIRTVNLGGVNDVSYFTGHGFTYVDSEPGRIVQILNETQCKNCIIYFDELDKIHHTEKGQAINGFLTHLIDPTQNKQFQDVYLSGLQLDVSKVLFVFSFNDETHIDSTVKDRLKIIRIKDPDHANKVSIVKQFVIPEICKNVNHHVEIPDDVIDFVISRYSHVPGIRQVKRVFEDIISKMNVMRMLDECSQKKMSFWHSDVKVMIDNIIKSHDNVEKTMHLNMYV